MSLDWTNEYAMQPLDQFQQIAPDKYLQRRNGRRIPPTDENGVEERVYESREISKEQYEDYMNVLNGPAQLQLESNFRSVQEGQDGLNGQSLVTMGALADLYELLTNALLQLQGGVNNGTPVHNLSDEKNEDL